MTDPFVIGEYEDRDRAQAALRAVASNGASPGAVEIEHEIVVVKTGHARPPGPASSLPAPRWVRSSASSSLSSSASSSAP